MLGNLNRTSDRSHERSFIARRCKMQRKRVRILVEMNLDPVPGAYNSRACEGVLHPGRPVLENLNRACSHRTCEPFAPEEAP